MVRDEQAGHISGRGIAMESTLLLTGSVVFVLMMGFGALVATCATLARRSASVVVGVDGMRERD